LTGSAIWLTTTTNKGYQKGIGQQAPLRRLGAFSNSFSSIGEGCSGSVNVFEAKSCNYLILDGCLFRQTVLQQFFFFWKTMQSERKGKFAFELEIVFTWNSHLLIVAQLMNLTKTLCIGNRSTDIRVLRDGIRSLSTY
jgi:hypothetical protein